MNKGKVYFVGAGPGDPELITRRGESLLRRADCVIYDRLVSPELLRKARRGCEKIYVGKEPDEGGHGQGRINRLLVEKAGQYRRVIRLKGGDPTVFGRLSEEIEVLTRYRIPFEIVPGVSSVWSAAASAGIPLTDRTLSSSVVIATGHPAAKKERAVHWEKLASAADTLVILMGRRALPKIVRRLRGVRPPSEPIALIRWASTPKQEVLFSTLGQVIQELKSRPEFEPPVVAIVGRVVRRPLAGRRIVLTRPSQDQPELAERLKRLGAVCVNLPTIEIRPRALPEKERLRLLENLMRYDWVIFNSHHGVEALDRLARQAGCRLADRMRGKICAIGPRTQRAVEAAGLTPDLVPAGFSTEGVRKAFQAIPVRGKKILIPRSERAIGDELAGALRKRGAQVEEVAMYQTVLRSLPVKRLRQALRGSDAITFTSASTVLGFLKAVKQARLPISSVLNGASVVAIGPATANALKSAGLRRIAIPRRSWTLDGLVEALISAVRPEPFGSAAHPELVEGERPAQGRLVEGRIGHGSTGSP